MTNDSTPDLAADWQEADLDQVALDAARRVTPEGNGRRRAMMQVAIKAAIETEQFRFLSQDKIDRAQYDRLRAIYGPSTT